MDQSDDASTRRWGWTVFASLVLAAVVVFFGIRWLEPECVEGECPELDELASYRPAEPPQVFDAEGELAGTLSGQRRIVVPLDSIPEMLREGYIAVEDRRFREHGGVDLEGGFRAFFENLAAGAIREGASTITMQLARSVFGSEVLGWNQFHRKLAEFRLARKLESQLTKDQILELYLNQIYLGDGVYGVETAARHYFGKSVSQVDPRETALLIGLARNPEGYDPEDHPEAADQRISTVVDVLLERGVIDEETAREAREGELDLAVTQVVRDWGDNAYYLAGVRRELRRLFPDPNERKGLKVFTGLDQAAQARAVETLGSQIRRIEAGEWGVFRHETPGDSLERVGGTSPYLQGMVVAMRPETGLVTTLVGGRDYHHSEFDRAFQAERQPGSAFKPIVYAAALGQGLRLNETISTDPIRFAQRGSQDWEPSDHVSGDELTVRDALVRSSNTASVRIGQRVGTGRVAQQAHAMGIESEIPEYPSIYLGAAEVVPAQLVAAYATFTNGGRRISPHLITRVENPQGLVVWEREIERGTRAVDPRIAFLVLDMMRDVVTRGTGWRVGSSGLSYPAAGKTGTTNDSKDLWFVGMTPELVAGVWIGFDRPAEVVPGAGGGQLAAPVWASFMQTANQGLGPMDPWEPPSGIQQVRIDAGTGYAVSEECPPMGEVRTEYFLSGTEPTEFCPYRGRYAREGWWRSDTVEWGDRFDYDEYRDSLEQSRRGRTIFWDDRTDSTEAERQRRLDSLAAARQQRMRRQMGDTTRPDTTRRTGPPDTIRIPPDTTRPDTIAPDPDPVLPDTIVPDTIPPDTTPPDTIPPGSTDSVPR